MDTLYARSQDGTRVGCEVAGQGPALLAIHGSTADRHRWDAVRDALAQRFRVHLMDRRGRGLSSDENADDYSVVREAEDIRALVEAIGEPVLVLSHSYGGAASLEAAVACRGIARMLVYEPALSTEAGALNPWAPPPRWRQRARTATRSSRSSTAACSSWTTRRSNP